MITIRTKTNCFAFDRKEHECKCLKELYCSKNRCSFYKDYRKTKWADIEETLKEYARISK